ncbi:hypothetical protein G5714_017475 [Onychostoma macrolepis]|uniref:Uncharacterized protein n=1 Tax=Onychostoma macrolepis TaxID=369639 RepID=A0A7J6C2S4_9TELE|nr:hypothetical protein G5714_017475 [Onychostoma macrolepis]
MFEMEKQTEKKNICSLDEFIHSQGLVDWPVTCEDNLDESSSHLYQHSGEICEDLRARVPFPSGADESLKNLLQTLETRVKLQNHIFTQTPD